MFDDAHAYVWQPLAPSNKDTCEWAALHVLHHNPKLVLVKEPVDVVDDVLVMWSTYHQNLVYDKIPQLLIKVNLLDHNWGIGSTLVGSKYINQSPK